MPQKKGDGMVNLPSTDLRKTTPEKPQLNSWTGKSGRDVGNNGFYSIHWGDLIGPRERNFYPRLPPLLK
jgi:hypothetical protein